MEPTVVVVITAGLALLLGLGVRHWIGFLVTVESGSMTPTLAPGQHLLARRPVTSRPLRRGDVVVVDSEELGRLVVKRVVGLPGEQVVIGLDGLVRVDGKLLHEPYVVHPGGRAGTFDVPRDRLLLLGDNRVRSNDSRSWADPFPPLDRVSGRVLGAPARAVSRTPSGAAPSGPGSPRLGPGRAG
jgi:signal peptidase I